MNVRPLLVASVVSFVGIAGCGDDRQLREWRPGDHGQPQQATDDRALPGGEGEGEAEPEPLGPEAEVHAATALWRVTCAGCHGMDGRGGGPQLPPMARTVDFTAADFQSGRTDDQLATVIVGGRNFMPAFGQQINPRGIAALVRHIRRFGAPPGGEPGEGEVPPGTEPQLPPGHPPMAPQLPPGHPPMDGLPPGHPPMGVPTQPPAPQLPPGHPK